MCHLYYQSFHDDERDYQISQDNLFLLQVPNQKIFLQDYFIFLHFLKINFLLYF